MLGQYERDLKTFRAVGCFLFDFLDNSFIFAFFCSGTMMGRVRDLSFVLCLLLRRVFGDILVKDHHLVEGLVNQHITLPCSFTVPDNWRSQEMHITWYKNFTEKLLDCLVKDGQAPQCLEHLASSRVHLSWKFVGNADLDIYRLQESDEGHYECWIIFNEAFQRQDSFLYVHGENGTRKDFSAYKGLAGWQAMAMVSTWNILLLSGWPFALLLAGILLFYTCRSHKRRNFFSISLAKAYNNL